MRMVMPGSQGVDAGCEGGEEGKEQKFWAASSFYAADLECLRPECDLIGCRRRKKLFFLFFFFSACLICGLCFVRQVRQASPPLVRFLADGRRGKKKKKATRQTELYVCCKGQRRTVMNPVFSRLPLESSPMRMQSLFATKITIGGELGSSLERNDAAARRVGKRAKVKVKQYRAGLVGSLP